ncbi:uncharacterized protein LOC131467094 isoform X2 [Solea solea]|uniref:uncharacterized protein LOC131467094 isoform X2 n=1 Tax=Solea solea TaxID=90069 RepID=UPI00272C99F7|nr:uncharacterized protein LOC131467094 isoform X2 [Solea solea]
MPTMVQWQLCTLDQLRDSDFGRPFPRHGLQLLFWFANCCVTFELFNRVLILKLVPHCEPDKGYCGFHSYGNIEKLLPVLRRHKDRTKVEYFVVGNLNTGTHPGAANLPNYVKENYGWNGNRGIYNIDRIIISYQTRTRVVETVYVTQHDGAASWSFSADRTYEINCELIQALQSPQLDLTTFLTLMGYYVMHYPQPSTQPLFNQVQSYSGSTGGTEEDYFQFSRQLNINSYSYNDERVVKANKKRRALRQIYWQSGWDQPYQGFNEEDKKGYGGGGGGRGGGGVSFLKILLGAGALYLAAKCFSCLWSCWKEELVKTTEAGQPLAYLERQLGS